MLEILVILAVIATPILAATRRRRRRGSRGFVAIPVNTTLALSTLGDGLVLSVALVTGTFTEDIYIMSTDLSAVLETVTAGEAMPMQLGVAHSDYSNVEVGEALAVALLGPGNKVEQERTRRLVRKVAPMNEFANSAETELTMIGQNGSRVVRTKVKFVVQNGKMLNFWIRNNSGGALTTGSILNVNGYIYGRWIL